MKSTLKRFIESLETLYKDHPEIAGEYFGAKLLEDAKEKQKDYALVSWCVADIQDVKTDWSKRQCENWLKKTESKIVYSMVSDGWKTIAYLLP